MVGIEKDTVIFKKTDAISAKQHVIAIPSATQKVYSISVQKFWTFWNI